MRASSEATSSLSSVVVCTARARASSVAFSPFCTSASVTPAIWARTSANGSGATSPSGGGTTTTSWGTSVGPESSVGCWPSAGGGGGGPVVVVVGGAVVVVEPPPAGGSSVVSGADVVVDSSCGA